MFRSSADITLNWWFNVIQDNFEELAEKIEKKENTG